MPDTSKHLLYSVKLENGNDQFTLRVLHVQTLATWRNSFKKSFVEQLTKRTGNYKSYSTFLSMLDFVLDKSEKQSSRELSFSVLTLSDLQAMKAERESETCTKSEHATDRNKRYFILKYKTKFETTHYPLPLNYAGMEQDDVSYLDSKVNTSYDNTTLADDAAPKLNSTRQSEQLPKYSINPDQQLLIEKQVEHIQELEDKLRKRGKTIKDLRAQIEDLTNEKKLLALKCKHLTADLAEYKRGFSRHEGAYKQTRGRGMSRGARAPNSRDSSPGDNRGGGSSSLARRSRSYDRPWASNSRSNSVGRQVGSRPSSARQGSRPSSATRFERKTMVPRRSSSVCSVASSGGRSRSSSIGRFDPTAYVEKQQNKRRKADIRRREKIRQKQSSGPLMPNLPRARTQPPIKNYVQENIRHSGVFETSIDVDMANIDARLNSLQAYIADLE